MIAGNRNVNTKRIEDKETQSYNTWWFICREVKYTGICYNGTAEEYFLRLCNTSSDNTSVLKREKLIFHQFVCLPNALQYFAYFPPVSHHLCVSFIFFFFFSLFFFFFFFHLFYFLIRLHCVYSIEYFAIARLTVFSLRRIGKRPARETLLDVRRSEGREKRKKEKKKIDDTIELVAPWSFSSRHLALLHGGPNLC